MVVNERKITERKHLYVCFDPVILKPYLIDFLSPKRHKKYTTLRIESHFSPHRSIIFKFPNKLLDKYNINYKEIKDLLINDKIAIKFYLNHIKYNDYLKEEIEIFVTNIISSDKAVGYIYIDKVYISVYHIDFVYGMWRCHTEGNIMICDNDVHNYSVKIKNVRNIFSIKIKIEAPKYNILKVITKEREFIYKSEEPKTKTEVANIYINEYPKKIIPMSEPKYVNR